MGNAFNHVSPAGTRAVTVYFDKGRLLQFSSPVPALRLMQENPNHLLVYSVVKAAELNSATQVSRDHVRIRVVHPEDMLQVSRVYFLVHIPEKSPPARSHKYPPSESSTPSASPRSARTPSARLLDSPSSASRSPRRKHHGASALSTGTVAAPSESPRPIGSCARQKSSFATKHPLLKSGAAPFSRMDSSSSGRLVSSAQIEKPRNTLGREFQRSPPTPPKPMLVPSSPDRPRKSSSQHYISNKGYYPVRNPRRSGSRRPMTGKPPGSGRQRPIGMWSPPHPKPHQPRPPGRRTVSDSVSLKEDFLCFSCCPRFKEEPERRRIIHDPSPAPPRQAGGGGRADHPRRSRGLAPSGSWRPGLDSISESSASFPASNSEGLIPNSFYLAKFRPPVHRRRR